MRSNNGHLAHGTTGNPQTSIDQEFYAYVVRDNERRLRDLVLDPMIDESLVAELERLEVKFNRKEMVFIARDKTGQIVWLENGTSSAGLTHLEKRGHIGDLSRKFCVDESDVPRLIRNIVRDGKVVSNKLVDRHGRKGYERTYEYREHKVVLAAIGTNGFLVTIYPI